MFQKILRGVCVGACVFLPALGFAQVSADDLGFGLIGGVQFSKAKPTIVLRPTVTFNSVRFDCERSDGQKISMSASGLRAGGEKRLIIPQGKGVFHYKCSLSGQAGKEKFSNFQLEFDTKVGEPPRIELRPSDVDEPNHKITVRITEPAGKIELDIIGDGGKPIANVVQQFKGEAPGTPLVVTWKQADDKQLMSKFQLKAYDPAGYFSGLESVQFIDIPHQDIVFESGKWDIRPSEEEKLNLPLGEIMANIKQVSDVLQINLYIGGYTDTVGNNGDNLELSRKRAQSIANWFAKKGLKIGIHFQGFGESVLAVPTPDGTDELRNRRASYVLASQPPPASRGFPGHNWARAH